jgi:flagellar hook assembly protein FlgD
VTSWLAHYGIVAVIVLMFVDAVFPAASVKQTHETRGGVVIRALAAASLQPGAQSLSWDGKLPRGSRAFGGAYVADVVVTSQVGTSDLTLPFTFTRVAP